MPIANEWKEIPLSQLFEFKNGLNSSKEKYGQGVKFINVMEVIYNDEITADKIPGSVQVNNSELDLYMVRFGDVLFNRTSETQDEIALAAVYLDTEPVVFGGFVIRARATSDELENNFKKYCFRSKNFRQQVVKKGQGGIRTNIGQGDLEKIVLTIPPKTEQKKISKILDAWDRSIFLQEKLIATKKKQKSNIINLLIRGKKRLLGFNGEWEKRRIGDLLNRISNGAVYDSKEKGGQIPITRIETISNSEIDFEKVGYTIPFKGMETYKILAGDILFSHINSLKHIGKVALYDQNMKTLYHGMNLLLLRPDKAKMSPIFLKEFLECSEAQLHFKRLAKKAINQASVNIDDVKSLVVSFPSLKEQSAISAVINSLNNEVKMLSSQLQKLKEQRTSLIQELLTGRKRIKT